MWNHVEYERKCILFPDLTGIRYEKSNEEKNTIRTIYGGRQSYLSRFCWKVSWHRVRSLAFWHIKWGSLV